MKIFFCSGESGGGDLALRLGMEGHKVRYYIKEPTEKKNLDGLIEKTENWREAIKWADYTILDFSDLKEVSSFILKSGSPAFGMGFRSGKIGNQNILGNEFQLVLEKDRKLAKSIMRDLRIGEVSESLEFSDVKKALDHIKDHPVAHVIKPEIIGGDSSLTYVGEKEDGSDSMGFLETLPFHPEASKIKKVEIEERIMGVEIGCSSYFNGNKFLGRPNINFEHKKLATGNMGPNTGEMGTSMFYESSEEFFNKTTGKMAEILSRFDYRGNIDINCIVNKDGIFPLEFTLRLGYPAIYIEQENRKSWGDFLGALASGENFKDKVNYDWSIGACLVGNGFPVFSEGYKLSSNLPIFGLDEKIIEHIHLYNVKFEKKRFLTTGCFPLIATARGKMLADAQSMLYKDVIPKVFFPHIFYRKDIGDRVHEDLKKLESYGYKFSKV